jgi:glycosyltransferase involved in cell wall biosynthesis
MEEVAGGAAVLVDPLEVSSIVEGIRQAETRRGDLSSLGIARAREFTWERAATSVVELWRELA